jgi:protease-4
VITKYSADSFIKDLRSLYLDSSIKGVMISMNTPGGEVEPSYRMQSEIAATKKPTYVHTNLLASGGLLAALPASKIIAAGPNSEIGSIGTVFTYSPTFLQFIKQNVKSLYSQHSPKKQSEYRALMEGDESKIMKLLDSKALAFQKDVKSYRDLKGDHESTLSGAMFTGSSAKRRGLIDSISTYSEALRRLKSII